ncbi:hypothetical protein [Candidatus Avelusimicrobium sp.]|uniref:hypothetical protein n=1 Tax=Candidatus Avelusimicrobium sp. TaxID=3048833 RepID=UPI003D7E5D27
MIFDSLPWKKELHKLSERLHKVSLHSKMSETKAVSCEKAIFISAYIIRKLFEASKLSYELKSISCQITKYSNVKYVDLLNWHNINQTFDLNHPIPSTLNIKRLCNYLIHSFVFVFSYDENDSLCGFYFTSDREKNKELYFMQIKDFIKMAQIVANDEKMQARYKRDTNGDFKEVDHNIFEEPAIIL